MEICEDREEIVSELLPHVDLELEPELLPHVDLELEPELLPHVDLELELELLPHVDVELGRLTLFLDNAPELDLSSMWAALLMVFVFLTTW